MFPPEVHRADLLNLDRIHGGARVSSGRATVSGVGFVPVTGTALLRVGDPPRDGVVEFTDERRTVALPIRAALPVLTKAHVRDDLHPSVRLLTSAALLGLRLVAAGRLEPAAGRCRTGGWGHWAERTRTGCARSSATASTTR
jgi:hypothetical protein